MTNVATLDASPLLSDTDDQMLIKVCAEHIQGIAASRYQSMRRCCFLPLLVGALTKRWAHLFSD